jgi:hypothetical protein
MMPGKEGAEPIELDLRWHERGISLSSRNDNSHSTLKTQHKKEFVISELVGRLVSQSQTYTNLNPRI